MDGPSGSLEDLSVFADYLRFLLVPSQVSRASAVTGSAILLLLHITLTYAKSIRGKCVQNRLQEAPAIVWSTCQDWPLGDLYLSALASRGWLDEGRVRDDARHAHVQYSVGATSAVRVRNRYSTRWLPHGPCLLEYIQTFASWLPAVLTSHEYVETIGSTGMIDIFYGECITSDSQEALRRGA